MSAGWTTWAAATQHWRCAHTLRHLHEPFMVGDQAAAEPLVAAAAAGVSGVCCGCGARCTARLVAF